MRETYRSSHASLPFGTVKPASLIICAKSGCDGKRSMDSTRYCR